MGQSSDTEGLIVSIGVVVILFSLAGSLATGMGPVDFFFISIGFIAMFLLIGGGVCIGGFAVYKAFESTKVDDGRTFWERLRQDYNWQTLQRDINTILSHLKLMIEEKREQIAEKRGQESQRD